MVWIDGRMINPDISLSSERRSAKCLGSVAGFSFLSPPFPSLRRRRSKPSVYSVCKLVHNIVFESRRVAKKYVGVIDWLFSFAVCD